ncbi:MULTISPECIES: type V toxin-antitoxin system endoribonuclease antitoxin GhoS [Pantoea]|uniref:type V toxin-antitoxin system endoribonuclease antitoxin GhoS n=1 Tax=Pantoea TaxID=53335 RepID=UPI0028931BBF|nr:MULTISPECIES: type V toxin-antitoxin system endoribonuclease antitoxin GhoS [unclassified Pantoea]MCG7387221.1 type V toxin-antitoxin system endoribonuclease antitoxin GhoS [Pantoea sp. ACRSB]
MSDGLKRYIVTFHYQESGLSDVQTLNSAMIAGGFSTTLNDDQGHAHELGTNSFGLVSALSQEDLQRQAVAAGESVLHQTPDVTVTTLEAFLRDAAQ